MTSLIAGTARRPLRSLAQMVTQPLVPRDFIDLIDPLSSSRDLRGRIESITAETAGAATIRIRVGRGWRGHLAGQYVRVGVDVDGVRQWRTYSITSQTNASQTKTKTDRFISITVKTVTDGVVSNYLVRRAKAGTLVHLDQASGDFTLPTTRPDKVLFVTAGSGITPVMGMLRNHSHELPDVVVVHSAPTAGDVVFGDELRGLAEAGSIRLVEHHTTTSSRITAADLDALVPDWADRQTWACGPAALLDDIEAHWTRHDAADRLHTERFTAPAVGGGDGGPISFTRTGSSVETSPGTTLLEAGENAGVLMPSGCRMGVCFGCVLPLRNGAVRDVRNGEVTIGAPDAGVLVQTCITTVAGSCEIDI
jgi:stearoyl-CoA 9-desaturase NADPH oxidoreductase